MIAGKYVTAKQLTDCPQIRSLRTAYRTMTRIAEETGRNRRFITWEDVAAHFGVSLAEIRSRRE